ncbi:uncharacterized protein C11orf52 homolog [Gracilinanus agilis]|uniref:uncharacterized protein C11orf52 homolog n=1 Tax=Gracilinanus agilis TaxID=191870 RepID=UPI001CFD3D13|nr:uncharacterized protein C11orf52 homolog [Gracilinanus agilis]
MPYPFMRKNTLGDRAPWETSSAVGEAEDIYLRWVLAPPTSGRNCPSSFHKKKKRGSKARGRTEKQKSTKGQETMGHTYELVSELPRSGEGNRGPQSEDSSLHYADIQVCSRTQPRSAQEVKHLQIENATEYATIRFPQATPHYDSKNGTLV